VPHTTPTLILKIKASTSFKCKCKIILTNLLVFGDVVENSIMTEDVVMPLNAPIMLVEGEKL